MIKSIKIEVDGKEVELSLEAARELYSSLHAVFGKPSPVEHLPPVWPTLPQIAPLPYYGEKFEITCKTDQVVSALQEAVNNSQVVFGGGFQVNAS